MINFKILFQKDFFQIPCIVNVSLPTTHFTHHANNEAAGNLPQTKCTCGAVSISSDVIAKNDNNKTYNAWSSICCWLTTQNGKQFQWNQRKILTTHWGKNNNNAMLICSCRVRGRLRRICCRLFEPTTFIQYFCKLQN